MIEPGSVDELIQRRVRYERFVLALRTGRPVMTIATIALCVAVYFVEGAFGGAEDGHVLLALGASWPDGYPNELWRLGSAMFLHGGLAHLAMNMYSLYVVGPFVERAFGRAAFLGLYGASGLAGFALSAQFGGHLSVGASGAIFGCFAAMPVAMLRMRRDLPGQLVRRVLQNAALVIGLNFAYGLSSSNIDNWGHLGGLACGALLSLVVPIVARGDEAPAGVQAALALPGVVALGCLAADAANVLTRLGR